MTAGQDLKSLQRMARWTTCTPHRRWVCVC